MRFPAAAVAFAAAMMAASLAQAQLRRPAPADLRPILETDGIRAGRPPT